MSEKGSDAIKSCWAPGKCAYTDLFEDMNLILNRVVFVLNVRSLVRDRQQICCCEAREAATDDSDFDASRWWIREDTFA